MAELKESCGLVGAVSTDGGDVTRNIWLALLAQQHRGQESYGIYIFDGGRFNHKKQLGLVDGIEPLYNLKGAVGIGHVRYSTVGQPAGYEVSADPSKIEDFAQPYFVDHPKGGIAFCHNGNLVNFNALREELRKNRIFLSATCDAEVMLKILAIELAKQESLTEAVRNCMSRFEGAYSVVALTGDGELVAFRDPQGFRPLCYGEKDGLIMFASESAALDINGIHTHHDVEPGELLTVSADKPLTRTQIVDKARRAHCMFEYVYFSRPDTTLEGKDVYSVRIRLGRNLARTYKCKADVIVPVPDTARPAAEGISEVTGIPVMEGLIKNRYIGRTFIMPTQEGRMRAVELKLNVIRAVVEGKRVLLVDDSIVRGNTMRKIVNLIREGGAKHVELWVTCPPIRSPCFYGIDMATHKELIAYEKSVEQVRDAIGVDELRYQTIEGLIEAIQLPREETCLACLTGQYPTPLAQKLADSMRSKTVTSPVRYVEIAE